MLCADEGSDRRWWGPPGCLLVLVVCRLGNNRATQRSNKNRPEGRMQPSDLVLNIALDLDQQSSADKKGFDRVAVEIFDADLLVPSHCMMRAMPTVDLLGHPLFVRFRRQSQPQSTIVEQLLDAAENFLQTPRERAADRRLAGEEVRNPTLEPVDRTKGMRPHRIQIEQAAELIFPE